MVYILLVVEIVALFLVFLYIIDNQIFQRYNTLGYYVQLSLSLSLSPLLCSLD